MSLLARGMGAIRTGARDAGGFTLVETIVAMVTGLIVSGALLAILEVATHQAARANDVAQATQLGRTSMTKVIDELRTACLGAEFTPIQEKSSGSELRFVNAYGEAAVIPQANAFERRIIWSGEPADTLTEKTFNATGGAAPSFTFSSTAASTTLVGEDITQSKTASGEAVPIFRYYKYATKAGAAETGLPVGTLTALSVSGGELSSTAAKEAASVIVAFKAAPTSNLTALGRAATFSNQVTLALGAPNAESSIKDGPCQ